MGKIKKILENELVGGTQTTDVYPVTSVKAVYDEDNERLDNIINRRGVVNISTNYNSDHIAEVLTLEQAIAKVPSKDRVLGFQGKFLSENGWESYVFTGNSISEWSDTNKWILQLSSNTLEDGKGYNHLKVMSQAAVSKELDKLDVALNLEYSNAIIRQWYNKEAIFASNGNISNASGWKRADIILDRDYQAIQLPIMKSNYGYGMAFFDKEDNYISGYSNSTIEEGTIQTITIPDSTKVIKYSIGSSITVLDTDIILIDSKFSKIDSSIKELGSYSEEVNYIKVYTDNNGNFLFGITADGEVEWSKGIPQPILKVINSVFNAINSYGYLKDSFHIEENDDFIKVLLDNNDNILFGIKKDGSPYFPNNMMYSVEEDTEYIAVWTDSEGRILFGIKKDGTIYPDFTNKFKSVIEKFKSVIENLEKDVESANRLYGANNVKEITGYIEGYIIALGSVGIGGQINYIPERLGGYHYAIVDCKGFDKFFIKGTGGSNPRLWAFIDNEDKIITMSGPYASLNNEIIQAPINAVKLIINDNTKSISYKGVDNILPIIQENSKNKNGILYEVPDDTISSFINGIKFSDELKTTLTDFKKSGDLMVHVSTFYIINDMIYVTYYVNTRSSAENPAEHTARFVYCNKDNMEQKTYIDLCDVGDTVLGKTVTALYDIVMFKKEEDDDILYLAWTVALDGEYYRVYRTYTISTGELGEIFANTFTVGDITETFSISGMGEAMSDNNIPYKSLSGDIGLMQKLSSRMEDGVKYYYTGCYVGPFNCIVKSSDLINWIFVAQPSFTNDSQWENATYVLDNKVYYCVRQYTNKSNCAFLTYYDLNSEQWANPVYMYEAQSRYDFFEYNDNLYLIHSPKDRNHLAIMKINKTYLNYSYDVQVATVPDYFYPFVQVYGSDIYISFTASRAHIYLSKVSIGSISTTDIITKFKELFIN